MAAHLLSVVCQMFFVKPSLEKRPSVYARGRMRLKEHEVPAGPFSASSKKMIEAHFKYFRGRGVARDVTTEFAIGLVGSDHHGERIPPHDGCNPFLDAKVARIRSLPLHRNRVAISRIRLHGRANTFAAQLILELIDQKNSSISALLFYHAVERLNPIAGFGWIRVNRTNRVQGVVGCAHTHFDVSPSSQGAYLLAGSIGCRKACQVLPKQHILLPNREK